MFVSFTIIVYSFFPFLAKYCASLYYCMELELGEYWLYTDMDIKCWERSHLFKSLLIGIPSIIIWIIGLPLLTLLYIRRNMIRSEEVNEKTMLQILHHKIKPSCYYWEFINMMRKLFLISMFTFLSHYTPIFQALVCLIVLLIFKRL